MNSATIDFVVIQMILTVKLYGAICNYEDGSIIDSLARKLTDKDTSEHWAVEYGFRHRRALQQLPGLVEWLGYSLCPAGLIGGPAFEFAHYSQAMALSGVSGIDWKKVAVCLASSAFWGAAGMLSLAWLPPSTLLSEDMAQQSLWSRLGWYYLVSEGGFAGYFFVWKLSEAGCAAIGIGYQWGEHGVKYADGLLKKYQLPQQAYANMRTQFSHEWNGCENVNIIGFYTDVTPTSVSRDWNMVRAWTRWDYMLIVDSVA